MSYGALIALILGAIVLAVASWYVTLKALQVRTWEKVADQLGLSLDAGGLFSLPSMSGQLHGVEVAVTSYYTITPFNFSSLLKVHSAIAAQVDAPLPPELSLSGEGGVFGWLSKKLGARDIQVGDPALDELLKIKGQDEDRIRALLGDANLRDALIEQFEYYQNIFVRDSLVQFQVSGRYLREPKLSQRLEAAAKLARTLNEAAVGVHEEHMPAELETELDGLDDLDRSLGDQGDEEVASEQYAHREQW